jgi:hypothetical protein
VIRGAGWVPVIGARRAVPDSACLTCHAVGLHHADKSAETTSCSSCHIEHTGSMHLAAAANPGCTRCHANLELKPGMLPSVSAHVRSFSNGHPDFRPLRLASGEERSAVFGLKFNHSDHLRPGLSGPQGKTTLQCTNCHRIEESGGRDVRHSGMMAPVKFARDCQSCHTLEFDKRVPEQAPHGDAVAALRFIQEKLMVTGHNETSAVVKAETILFREKCALCHTVDGASKLPQFMPVSFEAPRIARVSQPKRWLASAVFSHSAHSEVQCAECHTAAMTSLSGKDLLLPGIATCQRCHDGQSRPQGPALASGHAESGCFLCHIYHESAPDVIWHPAFRLDELVSR